MPIFTSELRRRLGTVAWVLGFGAAYALFFSADVHSAASHDALVAWFAPGWRNVADHLFRWLTVLWETFDVTLLGSTFLVPLGFVARLLARSRARAGHRDPFDALRSWIAMHPVWTRALILAAPATWAALLAADVLHDLRYVHADLRVYCVMAAVLQLGLGAVVQIAMGKAAVRALLAPTLHDRQAERAKVEGAEITFRAVAVTRETRAAVGLVGALSIAMATWGMIMPIRTLAHSPLVLIALGAYVAAAIGSAVLFRRASRITIGLDGVLVHGSSRTRFFAYRDLDEARMQGGDVELLGRGRVVLRLQFHGEDASRREAVLARLRETILFAVQRRDGTAERLAQSVSVDRLACVSLGGGDYRQAALTREQLWELVEGPMTDAATRTAAAGAIATSSDESERIRLRVAAVHCAQPLVRVALERLSDVEDIEDRPPASAHLRPAVPSLSDR